MKSYSAKRVNAELGQQGSLWVHEGFDRRIRSGGDFWSVARYIAENPFKEGWAPEAQMYPWLYLHPNAWAGLSTVQPFLGEPLEL